MTGFGSSNGQSERLNVTVEIRAVNNRYLKINARFPDACASLEGELERVIREHVARGTITLSLEVHPAGGKAAAQLNSEALAEYWNQIQKTARQLSAPLPTDLSQLLVLPGVVAERVGSEVDPDADWPFIKGLLEQALAKLQEFRVREGLAMADDLRRNAQLVAENLDHIAKSAADVVRGYRDKLLERVRELLKGTNVVVSEPDLIREVSLFADRCDINEEITRLRCHLEQFEAFVNDRHSQGRKLDFLTQEMFREVNTIGSKANNAQLARCVVEMKAAVERIREVLQNVE